MALLLLLAGALIMGGAILAALGRAGEMAHFPPDAPPLEFDQQAEPGQLTAADVALLRPPTSLWGYSMPATEEALALIARTLSARDIEIASLRRQLAELRDLRPQPVAGRTGTGTPTGPGPGLAGPGLAGPGLGGSGQTVPEVSGIGGSHAGSSAVDGCLTGGPPGSRGADGDGSGGAATSGGVLSNWPAFRRSGEQPAGAGSGSSGSGSSQPGSSEVGKSQPGSSGPGSFEPGKSGPGESQPGAAGAGGGPGTNGARWEFPSSPESGPHG